MLRRLKFLILHHIMRQSTSQIAKRNGITRQRVWQILKGTR